MPHLTIQLPEADLDPAVEPRIITALTDAVVSVYGEWVRPDAVVGIEGVPAGRWGVGGAVTAAAPLVTLNTREGALAGPDGAQRAARLISAITAAVGDLFGPAAAERTHVVLVGTPAGRSGVGGVPV